MKRDGYINVSISGCKEIHYDDDVDLSIDEFIDGLSDENAVALLEALQERCGFKTELLNIPPTLPVHQYVAEFDKRNNLKRAGD